MSKPTSTSELLEVCQKIAGITIEELCGQFRIQVPSSLNSNKGFIGQLLELALGADQNNLPNFDFSHLNIELKTIPINPKTLQPLESTYVCTAPFNIINGWEQSIVRLKLSKVLWVPIESLPQQSLATRRIGQAFLWQPSEQQLEVLKNDWHELTELLQLGRAHLLSARYGKYLQVRPKAANCRKNLQGYITTDGRKIKTVARGFYLRTSFTKQILLTGIYGSP